MDAPEKQWKLLDTSSHHESLHDGGVEVVPLSDIEGFLTNERPI